MARIVLNTFGSFGDLHPYLALAVELRRRGHDPVIATSEVYRQKVEAENVRFFAVRPDVGELLNQPEFVEKLWHQERGTEYLIRRYLMPQVQNAYEDLLPACQGADLLLTHVAAYAGPTVAEVLKLPWISIVLQPSMFLSRYDPPLLPAAWIRHLYTLGPQATAAIFRLGKLRVRRWSRPVLRLRRKLGLSTSANPVFEGALSPYRTLALFSEQFAAPQPDWPRNVHVTGFVFYDRRGEGMQRVSSQNDEDIRERISEFLERGSPPVVFTLGSSAVMQPGNFYRESMTAAVKLGVRAILLAGDDERAQLPHTIPDSIFVAGYAPYSEVLPRVALTVHQGGIGTTAQALRAGHPMLVVPWAHDQPDNAERLRRMGVAEWMDRRRYTADRAAETIRLLLDGRGYQSRAAEIGAKIQHEDGLQTSCDSIERFLREPRISTS